MSQMTQCKLKQADDVLSLCAEQCANVKLFICSLTSVNDVVMCLLTSMLNIASDVDS